MKNSIDLLWQLTHELRLSLSRGVLNHYFNSRCNLFQGLDEEEHTRAHAIISQLVSNCYEVILNSPIHPVQVYFGWEKELKKCLRKLHKCFIITSGLKRRGLRRCTLAVDEKRKIKAEWQLNSEPENSNKPILLARMLDKVSYGFGPRALEMSYAFCANTLQLILSGHLVVQEMW